jgi:hypothetical protein
MYYGQKMEKNRALQVFTIRLDDDTINAIKARPRNHRSAWLRRVIAAAITKDAA